MAPTTESELGRRSVLDLLVALRAAGMAADESAVALLLDLDADGVRARVAELRSGESPPVALVSSGPDSGACAHGDALWFRIATVPEAELRAVRARVEALMATGRLQHVRVDGAASGERGVGLILVGRPADARERALREVRSGELWSTCQTLWYCSIDENWQLGAVPFGHEILSRPPAGGQQPWSIAHLIDALSGDDDALREMDLACLETSARFMAQHARTGERFFLNVLPHTLLHEESRAHLERLLGRQRPGDVVLEVSERFPADIARVGTQAARLESRGLWVAIDDWGTAGADLAKLDAWPWTYLKVAGEYADISRRRASRPVLEALVRAHAGSLVVEGVEPGWHEDFLIWYASGARIFQGFLLSRPEVTPREAPESSDLFRPDYLRDLWHSQAISDVPPQP